MDDSEVVRPPSTAFARHVGAAALSAAIATEAMFAGFVLFGRAAASPPIFAELTDLGREWYQPERDLRIYVAGCALAVLLSIAFRIAERRTSGVQASTIRVRTSIALAVASAIGFPIIFAVVWTLRNESRLSWAGAAVLLTIPLVALFGSAAVCGPSSWCDRSGPAGGVALPTEAATDGGPRRAFPRWIDLVVCGTVVLLVALPHPSAVAGQAFVGERLHHWDFYAMGPTLAYLGGAALGLQRYTQYGVGWPVTFAALSRFIGVGYGQMIGVAAAYGCAYFVGVYALLRRTIGHVAFALAGTLLIVNARLFLRLDDPDPTHPTQWQWPSSTVLRSACDVWFFLALLAHARRGRTASILVAGGLVGVAVCFGTDTGLYLSGAFAIYCAVQPRRRWPQMAAGVAVAAGTCIVGLEIASRGHLFSLAFVHGWLEVFDLYPSGISMMPVFGTGGTMLAGAWIAMSMVATFLFVVSACVLRRLSGPPVVDDENSVRLALATYGLGLFLQYVGRSHPANLTLASVPLLLLVVGGGWRAWRSLGHALARQAAPAAALLFAAALLIANPYFRRYPNVIHEAVAPSRGELISVDVHSSDVRVDPVNQVIVDRYRAAIAELTRLREAGLRVAVFANDDCALLLYSGTQPWYRYTPTLGSLLTQRMLASVLNDLARSSPDVVFLPAEPLGQETMKPAKTEDAQLQIAAAVAAMGYRRDRQVAYFDLWVRGSADGKTSTRSADSAGQAKS